jgi:hypothetical protein
MENNLSSKDIVNGSLRHLLGILMLAGLVACAAVPTDSADDIAAVETAPDPGLSAAGDFYSNGNYQAVIATLDEIITDQSRNANSRRLAQLGKAMIYLGDNDEFRSVENAKMALAAAGQIVADEGEGFAVETAVLMDAISELISADTTHASLSAKSRDANRAVTRLTQERDDLMTERDELLAEQVALNDAIEKLKQLTLGD